MDVTFDDIVDIAPAITAIIATLTFLAAVGTLVKSVAEYSKQNSLRRFEKYMDLSNGWLADRNIQEIVELLESGEKQRIRKISIRRKEEFAAFFEEIAMMVDSKLLKKKIAYYMFGYYTILCDESGEFWSGLGKNEHYWSLFNRFAADMKSIRAKIRLREQNPYTWKFKF